MVVLAASKLMFGKIIPNMKPETMAGAIRKVTAGRVIDTLTLDMALRTDRTNSLVQTPTSATPTLPGRNRT
jgi:hypothetical protein